MKNIKDVKKLGNNNNAHPPFYFDDRYPLKWTFRPTEFDYSPPDV